MPVIDGIIDIPVPEWCSASDAVLWIMLKRPPVASHHLGLRKDDYAVSLGLDDTGQRLNSNPDYYRSWHILYEAACQGKVGIRGKLAIGSQKLVLGPIINWVQCESWGEFEEILPQRLKAASAQGFLNIERNHFLNDGMIYPTEDRPPTAWTYINVEVNSPQLIRRFHPAEGDALRIDGEVKFLDLETRRAKSVTKVAKGKNLGGRPSPRDWDGAINAAREAMRAGDFKPKRRPDLNHFLAEWLSARDDDGKCPDDSQIRRRVASIWNSFDPANGGKVDRASGSNIKKDPGGQRSFWLSATVDQVRQRRNVPI
jgi:hypothetical protein